MPPVGLELAGTDDEAVITAVVQVGLKTTVQACASYTSCMQL